MARCDDIPAWFNNPEQDYCAEQDPSTCGNIGEPTGCESLGAYALRMCDEEQQLFDCWAKEVVDIAGTLVKFYSLDLANSSRDPLYDEPSAMQWNGPYSVMAQVTVNERTAEAREEGLVWTFDIEAWVARVSVEAAGMPRPKEGDVMHLWDVPFFDQFGSGNSEIPGAGYYFDVIRVKDDGHLFDGPAFTGFQMELRRSTIFSAERRVFGDGNPSVT